MGVSNSFTLKLKHMKKLIFSAIALFAGATAFAQTAQIDQFFQKYEGKEGFTSVVVTEKLFSWVASAADNAEEWQSVAGDIKGIHILVYENAEGETRSGQYYNEFMASVPTTGFEELLNVTSETEKVRLYGKKIEGSKLTDMLMVCDADGEFVLISIMGAIDLDKISKMSDLDIEGLDELKKLENSGTEQK